METVLERLVKGSRVAVIRLRSLGDCVLTTPAIEILKSSRPDLKIGVVVEDRFAGVFEGNPDIDAILPPRLADIVRWRPELCINFHGGVRSLALMTGSGARIRAGFTHFRAACLYNARIPTAQQILGIDRKVHTAEHLASAVFYLGAARCDIPKTKLFTEVRSEPRPIVVLHPIASQPDKTWPADYFAAAAEQLSRRWGIEPVIIGSATDDLTAFSRFRVLAGATLSEIKALIASASLFIGNDSGPAHMAAALGTPLVVMFGNSDPVIWGPWRATAETLTSPGGIGSISVEQVVSAAERIRVTV